ncbi:MAG: radical SAM protein [Phycisphaerae bacterium]
MAGQIQGQFKELISPFLQRKMAETAAQFGRRSPQYLALSRQYIREPREGIIDPVTQRDRHYHSEMLIDDAGRPLHGVERLYRRTVLLILTTACKAHCRWCLRSQYDVDTLKPEAIRTAAQYFGSPACRDDVREVLITGGDPLMARVLVECALTEMARHAPNIEIVRIGTRLFMQDPDRIDGEMARMFAAFSHLRIEIGTHFNHPVEFWPETIDAIRRLQDVGALIYNQHPLLKGVNDSLEVLSELYDLLRAHGVEAHYLFHCVPMWGMAHHRTSVTRGLHLMNRLTSSGAFSGRAKPHYAAMTDVGKVSLYQGSILRRNERNRDCQGAAARNEILLQTGYRLDDRLRWNPSYRLPASARTDGDGYLRVWYEDGTDQPYEVDRQIDEPRDSSFVGPVFQPVK